MHGVKGSWASSWLGAFPNTLGITCDNISFIGQGIDKTIIRGGIAVGNKKNVSLRSLTLTMMKKKKKKKKEEEREASIVTGLHVEGEKSTVDISDVCVKKFGGSGVYVANGAVVKATDCEFSEIGFVNLINGSKGFFIFY